MRCAHDGVAQPASLPCSKTARSTNVAHNLHMQVCASSSPLECRPQAAADSHAAIGSLRTAALKRRLVCLPDLPAQTQKQAVM